MKAIKHILYIFLMFQGLLAPAQKAKEEVCTMDGNRIIFKLDRSWSEKRKKEVMEQFDLDSTLMANAFSGKTEFVYNAEIWRVVTTGKTKLELSKSLAKGPGNNEYELIMLDDRWINAEGARERESSPYGVNVFSLYSAFRYRNGEATFFLPERRYARNIYLAGTFNNWSTMQTPMIRCDSGWYITLKLKPGRYAYKYIIDGRWTQDPYNKLTEDDTWGGLNSVVYCYNYRFFLRHYKGSKNVFLAGSFNGWNPREIRMLPVKGGWAVNLYLREGTHSYKFIVDGEWMLDNENPVRRPDGSGHVNSFMSIGDTMFFRLSDHSAIKKVVLAGNFNAWNQAELEMQKTKDGWFLPYVLGPGNYEYKFILDGRWITDPDNPNIVGSGNMSNSFLTVDPNFEFVLKDYPNAEKVLVTGTFNGWSTNAYVMHLKDGKWRFSLHLKPGKYLYKFVVDGKWILDPGNKLWEENQYRTGNSVLWIAP